MIMMKTVFTFGTILLAWTFRLSTSVAEPEPIRGGNVDVKNEAIWTVSIQRVFKGKWTHFCGGSLINERDIITAAHCFVVFACNTKLVKCANIFRDLKKEKFRVVIGLNDLNFKDFIPGRGIEKKINRVFIHKGYKKKGIFLINDIAVVRLKKPLDDEDRKINPRNVFGFIPLFHPNETNSRDSCCIDREAFGAGFGATNITKKGKYERDGLRKILKVHFTDKCACLYPGLKLVHHRCEALTVQGFCMGDSGGPIYFKNDSNNSFELVGVISVGPLEGDLRPTTDDVEGITFIPEYLDFIESIKNVDESKIKKEKSLEEYEKSGATYFALPDHNNIAKLMYFYTAKNIQG